MQEFVDGGVLEQKTARPGAQRAVGILVEIEGGQDQDPRRRVRGHDPAGGVQPVHGRHPDVQQDHIGAKGQGLLDGGPTVRGLADHLDVIGVLQDHPEPETDEWLVVGKQNPDAHSRPGFGVVTQS